MTCDITDKDSNFRGSIAFRYPLAELSAIGRSAKASPSYNFISLLGIPALGLRPAQNTGSIGYFVGQKSTSELLVLQWPESEDPFIWPIVSIASIPTEDWEVKLPDGKPPNWLDPSNKIRTHITGLTRQYQFLWVAWTGARKVPGHPENDFDYPHISLAIIDTLKRELKDHYYIYHPDWAYAWPSLTTNSDGDVGMSFIWGGNKVPPQYAVTVLTDSNGDFFKNEVKTVSTGNSVGGGGHYTSIRQDESNTSWFSASGAIKIKDPQGILSNHPYYVLFMVDYYH
jgi:hypothetical protein